MNTNTDSVSQTNRVCPLSVPLCLTQRDDVA